MNGSNQVALLGLDPYLQAQQISTAKRPVESGLSYYSSDDYSNYQSDSYGGGLGQGQRRYAAEEDPSAAVQYRSPLIQSQQPSAGQWVDPRREISDSAAAGPNARAYAGIELTPQQQLMQQANNERPSNYSGYFDRPRSEFIMGGASRGQQQYYSGGVSGPYEGSRPQPPQSYASQFGMYDERAGGLQPPPSGARHYAYDSYGPAAGMGPPVGGGYNMPRPRPRARGLNTDILSPFYGIEELPFEDDEPGEVSVPPDFTADIDDVSALTRDAEIIAGIQPQDDIQISEETVQKAQEIEVTVPTELMGPEQCQLCQATFTAPQMAQSHYAGKKHAQRENQYIRKIYEEKGINVTRFLPKPKEKTAMLSVAPKKIKEPKKEAPKLKKYRFACRICDLYFENVAQLEVHITVVSHRKKVFDDQTAVFNRRTGANMPRSSNRYGGPYSGRETRRGGYGGDDGPFGGGGGKSSKDNNQVGDYFCSYCNKILNSRVQYDGHMESKKHLSKVKAAEQEYYDY